MVKTEETKQRRLLKKTRGGIILSEDEVKSIRKNRKSLKKEMRQKGIYNKDDFELTASSLGWYFDKNKPLPFWWLHGKGLALLLGAALLVLGALYLMSAISQMRGHFTINLSDGMFREGFTLSETADFEKPTTHLFAEPAVDVPCISLRQIPEDINSGDGQKNGQFFAYTFYLRNAGESTVGYEWQITLNSESRQLSDATWVMVFEDEEMTVYAEPRADGTQEALPPKDDDTRGYPEMEIFESLKEPSQYELIRQKGTRSYYRVIPQNFLHVDVVTKGKRTEMRPMETHRYTVVVWLEGDDPDCTDELIGGHLGLSFDAQLLEEKSK